MIGYYSSAYKVFWFFYGMLCALVYFKYLGMLLVALTPNVHVAAILASFCYTIMNLLLGSWCPKRWANHLIFSCLTFSFKNRTGQYTGKGSSSRFRFPSLVAGQSDQVLKLCKFLVIAFVKEIGIMDCDVLHFLQQIPNWWIWLYYICPTSWSLNGLLTSQFGDVDSEITVYGKTETVSAFISDYYGYNYNLLNVVGVLNVIYPLLFAVLFVICIEKLNFQRR